MAPKRKVAAVSSYADSTGKKSNARSATAAPTKRVKTIPNGAASSAKNAISQPKFDHSRPEEQYGIVQREFYPAEMSNERCAMYNNNEILRPSEVLEEAIAETKSARDKIKPGKAVLHWFKRDLRLRDNRGLAMAAKRAKEAGVPLITVFVVSPQDYQAHLTSPARVDFELRTLEIMKRDLEELDIPLLVVTQEKRKEVPAFLVQLCEKWDINHVFCNIEYEVDELRREANMTRLCSENGINFTAIHDDCVVPPGQLQSGSGKQYAVYTPWYRAWMAHIHSHPEVLDAFEKPGKNPAVSRKRFKELFDTPLPPAPKNKELSSEDKSRFQRLWPAGEHEALSRVTKFISQKIGKYKDERNLPGAGGTAVVSVHHSVGTLAARTSVRMAKDANSSKKLDGGNAGIATWISEVAWRDFYKHVLVNWPYVCMHKPFKYEYTNVEWEYDEKMFDRWCQGKTGFPIGMSEDSALPHYDQKD
jgi:deoxyribodipyrimidine photo-lyase